MGRPRAAAGAASAYNQPRGRGDRANGRLLSPVAAAAVLKAVNGGGDADTIGAVTGALAGARYGVDAIPARWTAPLWDRDEMIRLTGSVFGWTDQTEPV